MGPLCAGPLSAVQSIEESQGGMEQGSEISDRVKEIESFSAGSCN